MNEPSPLSDETQVVKAIHHDWKEKCIEADTLRQHLKVAEAELAELRGIIGNDTWVTKESRDIIEAVLSEQTERALRLEALVKAAYLEGNLKALSLHSRWECSDAFAAVVAEASTPPQKQSPTKERETQ